MNLQYLLIWNSAYHPISNGELFLYTDGSFFTENNGYTDEEIGAIFGLNPGEIYEMEGNAEYHAIVRLKNGSLPDDVVFKEED